MTFSIHTSTHIPQTEWHTAAIAYVIKEDGKTVYNSYPTLFTTLSQARSAAKRLIRRESYTLGLSRDDFIYQTPDEDDYL